ncbi:site-specific integrase [Burkholderia pseudomallei]|uniref:site-specific integrase n=2 Tax=Burkholderia pseudomallei TaxID=28450 RepID=UPI0021F7D030|nr:site-specific integrase [Burkholderia pseudomallei]MCW0048893.1 site-specific integrase [Burkholderia pseudomallei]
MRGLDHSRPDYTTQHSLPLRASALETEKGYLVKSLILTRGINRGERISVLIDRFSRTPVTLPNEYILGTKRLLLAPNTRYRGLSAIGIGYEWADDHGIPLAERLLGGAGLAPAEVQSLFAHVRQRQKTGRRGKSIVGASEQRARMIALREFVTSVMRDAAFNLNPQSDAEKLNALQTRIETVEVLFAQSTPKKEASPAKKGLTQDSLDVLVLAISPEGAQNPWKKRLVRQRNFVLVLLYIVTGGRRGDVAKLKIEDVVGGPAPYIRFDAHVGDPDDTRMAEPRLKTQPREYPVHQRVIEITHEYVREYRAQIPNSANSEYLFLGTDNGNPLSLRTINDIFQKLQRAVPGLTPHILRHTNNERLVRDAKALGVAREEMLRTIMYLNGWLSDNVATYTAREREETARTVATARQNMFFAK